LQGIAFPTDPIRKGGQEQGAVVKLAGQIPRQQGDMSGGLGQYGDFIRRKSVSQLFRFPQNQIPGILRHGAPVVEYLGNSIPGKTAGTRNVLHGDSSGRHGFNPFSSWYKQAACLHIVTQCHPTNKFTKCKIQNKIEANLQRTR
jgi:hypothetical protein